LSIAEFCSDGESSVRLVNQSANLLEGVRWGCHELNGIPARLASAMIAKLHTQDATQMPTYGQEWKKPSARAWHCRMGRPTAVWP